MSLQKAVLYLTFLGLVAGLLPAQGPPEETGLLLSLTAPTTALTAGTDFKVQVTMQNTSNHYVFYRADLSGKTSPFSFDVRDSRGGEVARAPRKPGPGAGGSYFRATLHPQESMTNERVLTRDFDFSKAGRYTIQAVRQADNVIVKSNVVTVTVVP